MIVALVTGSLFALALNREFGAAVTGIVTVGALPALLPPLSIPNLSLLRERSRPPPSPSRCSA